MRYVLQTQPAYRLCFVLSGGGQAEGQSLREHFGIEVLPDEAACITAHQTIEMLVFTLPLLEEDILEPQLPSTEPLPGESVPADA